MQRGDIVSEMYDTQKKQRRGSNTGQSHKKRHSVLCHHLDSIIAGIGTRRVLSYFHALLVVLLLPRVSAYLVRFGFTQHHLHEAMHVHSYRVGANGVKQVSE